MKNKRKNASSKLTCPLITLTSYSIPVTIAFLCVKLCSFNELYQWRYSSIHLYYLRIRLTACELYRQIGFFIDSFFAFILFHIKNNTKFFIHLFAFLLSNQRNSFNMFVFFSVFLILYYSML